MFAPSVQYGTVVCTLTVVIVESSRDSTHPSCS